MMVKQAYEAFLLGIHSKMYPGHRITSLGYYPSYSKNQ